MSLAVARLLGLPEAQWAVISTVVVTHSDLGTSLTVSGARFAGTALGAVAAAALATGMQSSMLAVAVGMFGLGLICAVLGMDGAAYRFAGITLAIVILASPRDHAWITAAHRFLEVSIGIATGLALTALWPERKPPPATREGGGKA